MTSRAEYRIFLRQDNADSRLTQIGRDIGLVTDERYAKFLQRQEQIEKLNQEISVNFSPKQTAEFIKSKSTGDVYGGLSVRDMIKRNISLEDIMEYFDLFKDYPYDILERVETDAKYEGYLKKGLEQIEKAKKLDEKKIPKDIDYYSISGLRLEAQEKLAQIMPENLGQASRISGVNPADIAVLMVYLRLSKG